MISAKQNICRGLLFAVCYLLAGCGGWIPSHKATMNEVYPPTKTFAQFLTDAPQGSVRERIFQAHYNEVYDAVEKSLTESEFKIHTTSKPSGIILVTQERLLEPPPDLLNCPNNHFANSKPQKWTYYIAIVIAEKEPGATLLRLVAKTQGRCFEGGGCLYGYDPCSYYAAVHWALGYESADKQLTQFISLVGNNLERSITTNKTNE